MTPRQQPSLTRTARSSRRALDRLAQDIDHYLGRVSPDDPSARRQLDAIIARFLDRYPAGAAAPHGDRIARRLRSLREIARDIDDRRLIAHLADTRLALDSAPADMGHAAG